MKKNNKGFFLAETIVVVALVTTVMAFLYPNISNLYDNYNNRTKYYDQTEDLYALRAVSDYFSANDLFNTLTNTSEGNGCKTFTTTGKKITDTDAATNVKSHYEDIGVDMGIDQLYLTGYMASPSSNNYNFNRYLKRMKKTTYDGGAYRLIGVFEATDKDENGNNITITRYASIKIDNPNPGRGCNLGG